MTLRGRLVALAVILAVLMTAGIFVLVRSRTADCTVVAPRPSLPAALRALGDFEQSYDVGNVRAIEDAATRVAGVLHTDLIGTTAEAPVMISATNPSAPDAVVVPLRSRAPPVGGRQPLAGLVVFLRDCQGNAYVDYAEDDASAQPPLLDFPGITREQAAAQLGTAALRLEYTTSPLQPRWVAPGGTERSLPAR